MHLPNKSFDAQQKQIPGLDNQWTNRITRLLKYTVILKWLCEV